MTQGKIVHLELVVWAGGILAFSYLDEPHPAWYDSIQKRAVCALIFMTGIAIAIFDWPLRVGWALVGLGLMYVLAAARFRAMNVHSGFALFYVLLVMLAFVPNSWLSRSLARPLMVWTGERSYSLFLFHFTA